MGVDISDLVEGKKIALEDLSGRSIAIDAFNTLYQFLSMIRQPDGTPLMDRDGRVTSHLSGLFYRSAALLELGIRPAYVFDGKPPELKKKTLEERRAVKEAAEREWKKAIEEGDLKKALSKATRTSRLDSTMIEESLTLLDALGIPWIKAPSEGEAQMAQMVRKGDVWAGASQDFDAILFGTPNLVRNLTLAGKRRLPSGKTVEVTPVVVTLSEVLSALEVTREQLVDMAVLMGTDFNEGIKGIGPKKALAIIKKAGDLEHVISEGKVKVPEEFNDIRRLFLEPDVTDDYKLLWGGVDDEAVRKIMCDKHGFSVDRIDSILVKITVKESVKSQKSLDTWS
ncbi:MAG: flap endonuclease-1 [Euryarchaeota archaeon RBG_19FT_COMBO_56_21]|nr:MAG: flap endonuclease-1 [Euryarchaeota archaeon RBG_19FT_COMBO_56_21]